MIKFKLNDKVKFIKNHDAENLGRFGQVVRVYDTLKQVVVETDGSFGWGSSSYPSPLGTEKYWNVSEPHMYLEKTSEPFKIYSAEEDEEDEDFEGGKTEDYIFGARKLCLNCTLKHLAQALVLLGEASNGYPMHKYYAMGHLAEAEAECGSQYIGMAKKIRTTRLAVQDNESPDNSVEDLIQQVHDIKERDGSGCSVC